ncbi:MAG: hypothetical protein HY322_02215 [Betaproteobacteria bacterium]|nr:hypothetical protein [Betaproteobacteria bacterium]
MAKISFSVDKSAERALAERTERLKPRCAPMQLDPLGRAIHFLRGVKSRATLALPAFYLFHGANAHRDQACAVEGYPGVVLKHAIEFSASSTVALSCRKAFDHGANGLTGANFAKNSDEMLERVAEYWSTRSSRRCEEALAALHLLRSIFRDCAKTDKALLSAAAPLGRRIGLLKQYADRSAAHLSMESYEFSIMDCVHVVAALTVIGEVIRSFDDPREQPTYFDSLDEASFIAARHLFPAIPNHRLFEDMKIEMQSRLCWQWGTEPGRQMLLEQLPYAIGWF